MKIPVRKGDKRKGRARQWNDNSEKRVLLVAVCEADKSWLYAHLPQKDSLTVTWFPGGIWFFQEEGIFISLNTASIESIRYSVRPLEPTSTACTFSVCMWIKGQGSALRDSTEMAVRRAKTLRTKIILVGSCLSPGIDLEQIIRFVCRTRTEGVFSNEIVPNCVR